jgi:hypothetical protein
LVELGAAVLKGAERLILQTPVRTLDALHIASALVLQVESGAVLRFATADATTTGTVLRRPKIGVGYLRLSHTVQPTRFFSAADLVLMLAAAQRLGPAADRRARIAPGAGLRLCKQR